jgi:hypothetical protein
VLEILEVRASSDVAVAYSLALIEPPLFHLVADDPDVTRLRQRGEAFLNEGLDTDPAILREFRALAGGPSLREDEPLPAGVEHAVRRAHGGRLPSEARPPLEPLRAAAIPSLVASGAQLERHLLAAA